MPASFELFTFDMTTATFVVAAVVLAWAFRRPNRRD